MNNWRTILSWRGPEDAEPEEKEFIVYWTASIDGYSKVMASDLDTAYDLARHGHEYDFRQGNEASGWEIYRVEDPDSGETFDV